MNKLFFILLFLSFFACKEEKTEPKAKVVDIKNRLIDINLYLSNKDKDVIDHFIRRQEWDMKFSDNGFFYEILEQGELPLIKANDQIVYDYTIKQLDGTLCYTSENGEPNVFSVGMSEEISGLHMAIKLLGKGGKARFIFPPQLAYGLIGDRKKIPALATLVYHVEILDVER